mmetsp:Transcript_6359/g.15044  ORF Transcript_6359/g.15044 Transcript_6359/m.15044 type:complete len:83 (+) Transcript_6359:3163-3411(+)
MLVVSGFAIAFLVGEQRGSEEGAVVPSTGQQQQQQQEQQRYHHVVELSTTFVAAVITSFGDSIILSFTTIRNNKINTRNQSC